MRSRLSVVVASALVALAIAVPSYAQGKSAAKKPTKGPTRPPSSGTVSTPSASGPTAAPTTAGVSPTSGTATGARASTTSAGSTATDGAVDLDAAAVLATTTPFAWLDDASVLEPGTVWVGVSMARWQGSGFGQTIVPVVDAAIGVAPRVQVGASVPRVAGGLGTMFFTTKIALLNDDVRALKVAVGPSLEVLPESTFPEQGRTNWGIPVSAQIDRGNSVIYASSGYFSPGIWYAGAGIGRPIGDRLGISASFSHAWAASSEPLAGTAMAAGPRRNEVSGGVSYDLKPNMAVFGSMSRTLGITAEEGAGTMIGFGLSLSGATDIFTK